MSASAIGDSKMVQFLLKAGALVNLQDLVRLMDELMHHRTVLYWYSYQLSVHEPSALLVLMISCLSCHNIMSVAMQLRMY